jgi:Lrp/AsnC family leucine-responsive transcriptional regulator
MAACLPQRNFTKNSSISGNRPLTFIFHGGIKTLRFSHLCPNFFNLLDKIDLKILYILQNDGRRRLADIAEEVDLSAPAVMERVKKLEAGGVIRGYQALVDGKKVGKDITAFIGVSVGNQRDIDKFAAQMMRYADVLECHHVTGEESFVLKVKAANTAALEKLLGDIRSVEGVTRTVTKVVLSTAKEGLTLDLDACVIENSTPKKKVV